MSIINSEINFKELVEAAKLNDPLKDLHNYNNMLTISQVVKFFEKQGMTAFTKTMIQNYVRVGVLPVPKDKRYYLKEHMMVLVLIDCLKTTYSLDEIKKLLEMSEHSGLSIEDLYDLFLNIYNSDTKKIVGNMEKLEQNQHTVCTVLQVMAGSVAMKSLAKVALEKSFA